MVSEGVIAEQWLVEVLRGDAQVEALVGERVYSELAPQGAAMEHHGPIPLLLRLAGMVPQAPALFPTTRRPRRVMRPSLPHVGNPLPARQSSRPRAGCWTKAPAA